MAKQGGSLAARLEKLVKPTLEELGFCIWEVSFEKEGPQHYLRILIDKADESLMDTDSCEQASRAVDPLLDEADLISESYYLEVGSPGLGRSLTKPWHFEKYLGETVLARLYKKNEQGQREIKGKLLHADENGVLLENEGAEMRLEYKQAGSFKLCDDENLF